MFVSNSLHVLSNAYGVMLLFNHVCLYFHVSFYFCVHCFSLHRSVCLDESKHIGRHPLLTLFNYTRAYLHINAYCCVSVGLSILVCACIYTLAFTCALLHLKDCMYLCAPPSKCLHFLVCA